MEWRQPIQQRTFLLAALHWAQIPEDTHMEVCEEKRQGQGWEDSSPLMTMEDVHSAEPASFVALQVYKPASAMLALLTWSNSALFLNVISQLEVGWISTLFLYQATVIGWEPATRPSSLNEFPSVSSTVSESFLVKLGGIRRSVRN